MKRRKQIIGGGGSLGLLLLEFGGLIRRGMSVCNYNGRREKRLSHFLMHQVRIWVSAEL